MLSIGIIIGIVAVIVLIMYGINGIIAGMATDRAAALIRDKRRRDASILRDLEKWRNDNE